MKVAIGRLFRLSDKAVERCLELGMTCTTYHPDDENAIPSLVVDPTADFIKRDYQDWDKTTYDPAIRPDDFDDKWLRTNPIVIQVIEELGVEAAAVASQIKIIEIPFDSFEGWYVEVGSQGYESIHEKHRIWD